MNLPSFLKRRTLRMWDLEDKDTGFSRLEVKETTKGGLMLVQKGSTETEYVFVRAEDLQAFCLIVKEAAGEGT